MQLELCAHTPRFGFSSGDSSISNCLPPTRTGTSAKWFSPQKGSHLSDLLQQCMVAVGLSHTTLYPLGGCQLDVQKGPLHKQVIGTTCWTFLPAAPPTAAVGQLQGLQPETTVHLCFVKNAAMVE